MRSPDIYRIVDLLKKCTWAKETSLYDALIYMAMKGVSWNASENDDNFKMFVFEIQAVFGNIARAPQCPLPTTSTPKRICFSPLRPNKASNMPTQPLTAG